MDILVVHIFKVFNKTIEKQCPWIWQGVGIERRKYFSQCIDQDNKRIEAARFAIYPFDSNNLTKTQDSLCKFHIDKKNGKDGSLSQVLIFSKMLWMFLSM